MCSVVLQGGTASRLRGKLQWLCQRGPDIEGACGGTLAVQAVAGEGSGSDGNAQEVEDTDIWEVFRAKTSMPSGTPSTAPLLQIEP